MVEVESSLKMLIDPLVGNLDELDRNFVRQRFNCILLFQENADISIPISCANNSASFLIYTNRY